VLLREHWATVLKQNSVSDLQKLLQVQAFIKKKTSNLNKYIQLKGKLEMAKRTLDIKPAKSL
jgi:hypothetical protein